ncbi:MAG: cyclic nucleotide-binding domain-containing protein [Dongiaceae bacterium]
MRRLRAVMMPVQGRSGDILIREGEPAVSLFNVVSGTVKLYKLLSDGRRQITGFLVPGDFLGIALNKSYAYSAEAIDDVHLCRFDRGRFRTILTELPKLEHRLFEAACNELVAAQDQMLLLGRRTAIERVASFLVHWQQRSLHARTARVVSLPMSRGDIADYLGLTIETVSRTIGLLKRDKIISVTTRTGIDILKPERLAVLAEVDCAEPVALSA